MITVDNLGVKKDKWILREVDFRLEEGEKVGLIGLSGVGKSTFLKALSGHIDIQEGKVQFKGKTLIGPGTKLIPGYKEIQLVDQEFRLDPYHTVEENIREVLLYLSKEERDDKVNELLDLIELRRIKDVKAHLISGGEKQRLALVRAIALEPEVLLLDEPFVHLDTRMKEKMMRYIDSYLEKTGMSIIIASHDGAELLGMVDRIIHISEGNIVRSDNAHDFYYNTHSIEQAGLLGFINEIEIKGRKQRFRPTQYRVVNAKGIALNRIKVQDKGGVYFHNYLTLKGEEVVLIALSVLEENIMIDLANGID